MINKKVNNVEEALIGFFLDEGITLDHLIMKTSMETILVAGSMT